MLRIRVEPVEVYDYANERFVKPSWKPTTLILEHSLLSLSKWESKWKKPFLVEGKEAHTDEEMLDYIRCMTINDNVDPDVYNNLTAAQQMEIAEYIQDSMTATVISNDKSHGGRREIITSEVIYYWMIEFGIYKECEKWHLNRLLTLINVISIKRTPQKKMSRSQVIQQQRQLNAMRRSMYNSKG